MEQGRNKGNAGILRGEVERVVHRVGCNHVYIVYNIDMQRKQLSLIRLFKMANMFLGERKSTMKDMQLIGQYLKYVNLHKNEDL